MALSIKKGSENYCAQVIKLPAKVAVKGLDNLVQVTYQGNQCLIGKDSDPDIKYLFIPSGAVLSEKFLHENNLFRHSDKNADTSRSGFFDDSGRVKAIKFKGIISTGFIIPQESLKSITTGAGWFEPQLGDSFTTIDGVDLCWKYIKPQRAASLGGNKVSTKLVDSIVDEKYVPEHQSTEHFLRNIHQFNLDTEIVVTAKIHGTSGRLFNAPIQKKLSFKNRLFKLLGGDIVTTEYTPIVGSRRVIKSVNFKTLSGKLNYYSTDLWSSVCKNRFEGKLNSGEAVYFEIAGLTPTGEAIQKNYSYHLSGPEVFIYRITNINTDGIEVDLSWNQLVQRAEQLGVKTVPLFFRGTLNEFIARYQNGSDAPIEDLLEHIFYDQLLEKPSMIDPLTLEEGFCIRIDAYPKIKTFKIKSRTFLLQESNFVDKEVVDIEEEN